MVQSQMKYGHVSEGDNGWASHLTNFKLYGLLKVWSGSNNWGFKLYFPKMKTGAIKEVKDQLTLTISL